MAICKNVLREDEAKAATHVLLILCSVLFDRLRNSHLNKDGSLVSVRLDLVGILKLVEI